MQFKVTNGTLEPPKIYHGFRRYFACDPLTATQRVILVQCYGDICLYVTDGTKEAIDEIRRMYRETVDFELKGRLIVLQVIAEGDL